VSTDPKHALQFSDSERTLLRERYKKLTDVEFAAFLSACSRYQLNPLANQVYARLQPQTDKNARQITYMTQIDGYRLIADRTGMYAGNDDPRYDNENNPKRATVTVYKIVGGQRCGFEASARWDQYYPGPRQGFMWTKMPHLMLGKCAEALALRKAFPMELSGLYTAEEMEQADTGGDAPDPLPAPTKPAPKAKATPPAATPPAKTAPDLLAESTSAAAMQTLIDKMLAKKPVTAEHFDVWTPAYKAAIARYQEKGWANQKLDEQLHEIGDALVKIELEQGVDMLLAGVVK
jgi:phage recombination protein Bet